MRIHLISGFLGSGKTTAIQTACKILQTENIQTAVITNDQGINLVDTKYFNNNSVPNRQVINGCFCCNYNALDENIQSLILANHPDVIFAESVGSCTDIIATVMKPLMKFHKDIVVTASTFADARLLQLLYVEEKHLFNNEVYYIYQKQLEEAIIIVVSKIDLISEEDLRRIQNMLHERYPRKTFIYINGTDEKSIRQWTDKICDYKSRIPPSSLNINYDVYGAGEAMLAWLDADLKIFGSKNNAQEVAVQLTRAIYDKVRKNKLVIGHLKFLIDNSIKISYTSAKEKPAVIDATPSSFSSIIINARIQTTPEFLQKLVDDAVALVETGNGCKIIKESIAVFKPGFPKPVHRII